MTAEEEIARRFVETLAWLVAGGAVLIAGSRALVKRRPAAAEDAAAPDAPPVVAAPLWVRLGTLIALAFAVFVPAWLGPIAWTVAMTVLVALALGEFWEMLDATGVTPHRVVGYLAGLALPVTALLYGPGGLATAATAAFVAIAATALFSPAEDPLPARLGGTLLGVLYVAGLAAHLVLIGLYGGFGPLVFFLMVIQLADVGGLMGGVLFGRHKLVPRLSPGKTWEGTIAGLLAAGGAAWLFAFAMPAVPVAALVAIGLLLALASMVGDLLASGFKRAAGLKDFGRVLPGHGGILDRFDGYLYAAPVFWWALTAIKLAAG